LYTIEVTAFTLVLIQKERTEKDEPTFLSNQTFAPRGQAHHYNTYPSVLGLYTSTISLSAWSDEFPLGHAIHLWLVNFREVQGRHDV
jgi:hypothetical protein